MTRLTILLLSTALALTGCDRSESETPEEAEHRQIQSEGQAWRDLKGDLNNTDQPPERIKLLERFITDYPEHPDIAQAKEMMEEAKAQVKHAEAFQKVQSQALDEGNPIAVLAFFASDIARQATQRALVGEIEEFDMPTANGTRTFENQLFFAPTHLRGRTRIALTERAPELVEDRCNQECVNNAVNNLLQGTTGEPLFAEPGRMNPAAVKALFEKVEISADLEVMGVGAEQFYTLYQPTVRAFARTRDAAKAAGLEDAAETLQNTESGGEIKRFYRKFTTENGIAEATELEPKTARAFTSWWIRRWADGTGPIFDAKLDEVLDTFDPEFLGAEEVEDAGEEK